MKEFDFSDPDSLAQEIVEGIKHDVEARGMTMESMLRAALDTQVGYRALRFTGVTSPEKLG